MQLALKLPHHGMLLSTVLVQTNSTCILLGSES